MRKLLWIPLGLLGLLIIAVLAIVVLLDPNEYRAEIEAQALQQAGIELRIEGELDWFFFPSVGLEIGKLSARYPQREPFAAIEGARVSVAVLPLLGGTVQAESLELRGADLRVITDADGRSNLDGAAAANSETTAAEPAPQSQAGSSTGSALDLRIDSLQLSDARLLLEDRQAGTETRVESLNLNLRELAGGQDSPLALTAKLEHTAGEASHKLDVNMDAVVNLDLRAQRYRLQDLVLLLQVQTGALPSPLPIELKARADLDLEADQLVLETLQVAVHQLQLAGELQVLQLRASPSFAGKLTIAEFSLPELLQTLGQSVPETRGEDRLRRLAMEFNVQGSLVDELRMEPIKIALDDTEFEGEVRYQLDSGAVYARLRGDQIVLDEYLPPAAEEAAPVSADDGPAEWSKEPLMPLDTLRGLDLDTAFDMQRITLQNVAWEKIHLGLTAKDGLIRLDKVSTEALQGSVKLDVSLDARSDTPEILVEESLANIQIGDYFLQAHEVGRVAGSLDANATLSMRGNSVFDLVNSLNGEADYTLKDGRLNEFNLMSMTCGAISTLSGKSLETIPTAQMNAAEQQEAAEREAAIAEDFTRIASLGGKAIIKNGVISNSGLSMAVPGMSLGGEGSVSLPERSLDMGLTISLLDDVHKYGCPLAEKYRGKSLPLKCDGYWDDEPIRLCTVDVSRLLTDEVKEKVKEKAVEKLQDLLGSDKLKRLFKR